MRFKISDEEKNFLVESAFLLKELGKFEEAKNVFRGLISLFPESELPYAGYSQVLMAQQKVEEAESFLKNISGNFKNSELIRFHLGEALLLNGKSEEAREIFSKNFQGELKNGAKNYLELIKNLQKK